MNELSERQQAKLEVLKELYELTSDGQTRKHIKDMIDKLPMKYITIRIPIIDTGHTSEQKRQKMLEELDELLAEFATGPVDAVNAFEEFYDVAQVMFGYILAYAREDSANLEDPVMAARSIFNLSNAKHIEKMRYRAIERGWNVIR